MTAITESIVIPRLSGRIERLAVALAKTLIVWANSRSAASVSREEHSLRVDAERGIQAREHAALRLVHRL